MVSEAAVVEVDTNHSAALLSRVLNFSFDKNRLCVCVVADQEDESVGKADLLRADRLDVVRRLGVDCLVELKVRKVEVDVFMGPPCAHQV